MATLSYTWNIENESELSQLTDSDSDDEVPESQPEPAPPVITPTPKVVRPTKTTRPSTQQATKQSRDRIASKALPYLKSPRTTTYALSSLHAVVWTTQKQESLIDSFYHNFYVPPIIFATTTREEDGAEIRTCIDGKQRLTSMRLFMDGELSHKDSVTGRRSWFSNPNGSKRKLITPQWQSKFKGTQIACVEYDDITEEQQREIFQRVQMGVTLTPAERLQSVNGPIADLIREVRARMDSPEGFEGYLDWGKIRGKDFKALAEIAYLITHAKTTKSEPTVQRLEAFLDNKTQTAPIMKRREGFLVILQSAMSNVIDIFCRIVRHPELGEPLRKNLSPLEFVMSAYLVFLYRKNLSDTQLSHAIAHMRQDANRSFEDMKYDSAKCKHFLTFIHKSILKLIPALKPDDEGDVPAMQGSCQRVERNFGVRFKNPKVENTSTKPATKRKRKAPEDERYDSDDELLQAKKRKVKRKGSGSAGPDEMVVGVGPPPKPRASTTRFIPNVSRSAAPVSKAKTTIKSNAGKKEQTTSSQMGDVKKSTRSIPVDNGEGLQVAIPSVKPPPSMRIASGPSQQVISKLGAHLYEPVPLGKRAEAARTALNQPGTGPVIPATQTAPTPSISVSQGGPPLPGRHRSLNSDINPPITLPSFSPSTSSGINKSLPESDLPPDAPGMIGNTSGRSARMRARMSLDRLAPVRSAKAAASSRMGSMMGSTSTSDLAQVPRPGSVTVDSPSVATDSTVNRIH